MAIASFSDKAGKEKLNAPISPRSSPNAMRLPKDSHRTVQIGNGWNSRYPDTGPNQDEIPSTTGLKALKFPGAPALSWQETNLTVLLLKRDHQNISYSWVNLYCKQRFAALSIHTGTSRGSKSVAIRAGQMGSQQTVLRYCTRNEGARSLRATTITTRRRTIARALAVSMTALFLVSTPVAASFAQPSESASNEIPTHTDDVCDPAVASSTTTTTTTTTAPTTTTTTTTPTAVTCTPEATASEQTNPSAAAPTTSARPTTATETTGNPTPAASSPAQTPAPAGKKIPYTGLPTENPNETIVPGKMRSDREEIPEGFTKEQADETEMMEARSQKQARTSRAAPGCQEYWPAPFQVCGAIRDKYNSLGAQFSFLLLPTSNELTSPDGHGKFTTFMNGPIYWSAAGGAHPVVNSFLNRWGHHGYETGWMGYPTTDEIVHADGIGRRQEFQHGAIYVSVPNAIGSSIGGSIRDKWNTLGAETPGSVLGYPISDEIVLPDGQGRMNRFERGVIYWHPNTGAHEIYGSILPTWEVAGYENGALGYPIDSRAMTSPGSYVQHFQNGELTETGATPLQEYITVSGFYDNGQRGIGGRFCQSGYFGWSNFDSLRTSLDASYARNGRVWQVADNDEVWKVWCKVTRSKASIVEVDNSITIKPGPRYDLEDGTICFFRLTSRSGGFTIDFNSPNNTQNWKVHVA